MGSLLLVLAFGCDRKEPEDTDEPSPTSGPTESVPTTPPVVDRDGDGWSPPEDCNDEVFDVHPDADERCNGNDEDCDGTADEDAVDAPTWYVDGDGDGYGTTALPGVVACEEPTDRASNDEDCDDTSADVKPGRSETCNGIDDDCDPTTPEDGVVTRAWRDSRVPLQDYTGGIALELAVDDLATDQILVLCPGTYDGFQVWDDPSTYPDEWPWGLDAIVLEGLAGAGATVVDGPIRIGPHYASDAPSLTIRGLSMVDVGAALSAVRVEVDTPVITIEDSVFADNAGRALSWSAASFPDPTIALARTRFERNSGADGGAIGSSGGWPDIVGTDLVFVDNHASAGGAVSVGAGTFTCTACVFEGNTVDPGSSLSEGGSAIHATSGTVTLIDGRLERNVGAAAIESHGGHVELVNTDLVGNEGVEGGALHLSWSSTAAITGGTIRDNEGSSAGGGVFFRASDTATVTADGVDIGGNLPDDVLVFQSGGATLPYVYDSVVSFTCDPTGCR